jgi:DNA-binding NarL/FixJ family response regulator
MIRVIVVDDQALIRAGFRMILESEPDVTVVGEAADGLEAIDLVPRARPDVVLMDIRMPRLDGVEATARITAAPGPPGPPKVLMLTTFDIDEYVFAALRAGASGFLLKDTPPEHLVDAVRLLAAGEGLLAPSVTRRLIEEFARHDAGVDSRQSARRAELAVLTERELEALSLIGRGLSNQEISAQLYISQATTKTYVSRLLAKLPARDRAQLVVLAYESGLVRPGQP